MSEQNEMTNAELADWIDLELTDQGKYGLCANGSEVIKRLRAIDAPTSGRAIMEKIKQQRAAVSLLGL